MSPRPACEGRCPPGPRPRCPARHKTLWTARRRDGPPLTGRPAWKGAGAAPAPTAREEAVTRPGHGAGVTPSWARGNLPRTFPRIHRKTPRTSAQFRSALFRGQLRSCKAPREPKASPRPGLTGCPGRFPGPRDGRCVCGVGGHRSRTSQPIGPLPAQAPPHLGEDPRQVPGPMKWGERGRRACRVSWETNGYRWEPPGACTVPKPGRPGHPPPGRSVGISRAEGKGRAPAPGPGVCGSRGLRLRPPGRAGRGSAAR